MGARQVAVMRAATERLAMLVLAAITLWACSTNVPAPTPTPVQSLPTLTPSPTTEPTPTAIAQAHECGNLSPEFCEQAIAAVIRETPMLIDSPGVVAATLDPDRPSQRGGDTAVLVAFAPVGGETDMWSPGVWVATQPMLSSEWRVEVWRQSTLPPHFVELMQAAGMEI